MMFVMTAAQVAAYLREHGHDVPHSDRPCDTCALRDLRTQLTQLRAEHARLVGALTGVRAITELSQVDDADSGCGRCSQAYANRGGDGEPGFCDPCAQEILAETRMRLETILSTTDPTALAEIRELVRATRELTDGIEAAEEAGVYGDDFREARNALAAVARWAGGTEG